MDGTLKATFCTSIRVVKRKTNFETKHRGKHTNVDNFCITFYEEDVIMAMKIKLTENTKSSTYLARSQFQSQHFHQLLLDMDLLYM